MCLFGQFSPALVKSTSLFCVILMDLLFRKNSVLINVLWQIFSLVASSDLIRNLVSVGALTQEKATYQGLSS